MKKLIFFITILYSMTSFSQNTIYDIPLQSIDNESVDLKQYKGKYILFVNVASYCGYTNQYSDLQKLHDTYNNLEVIGLPCNQFLFQEPFSQDSIKKFCERLFFACMPCSSNHFFNSFKCVILKLTLT